MKWGTYRNPRDPSASTLCEAQGEWPHTKFQTRTSWCRWGRHPHCTCRRSCGKLSGPFGRGYQTLGLLIRAVRKLKASGTEKTGGRCRGSRSCLWPSYVFQATRYRERWSHQGEVLPSIPCGSDACSLSLGTMCLLPPPSVPIASPLPSHRSASLSEPPWLKTSSTVNLKFLRPKLPVCSVAQFALQLCTRTWRNFKTYSCRACRFLLKEPTTQGAPLPRPGETWQRILRCLTYCLTTWTRTQQLNNLRRICNTVRYSCFL